MNWSEAMVKKYNELYTIEKHIEHLLVMIGRDTPCDGLNCPSAIYIESIKDYDGNLCYLGSPIQDICRSFIGLSKEKVFYKGICPCHYLGEKKPWLLLLKNYKN